MFFSFFCSQHCHYDFVLRSTPEHCKPRRRPILELCSTRWAILSSIFKLHDMRQNLWTIILHQPRAAGFFEFPAYVLSWWAMDRYGRRWVCTSQFIKLVLPLSWHTPISTFSAIILFCKVNTVNLLIAGVGCLCVAVTPKGQCHSIFCSSEKKRSTNEQLKMAKYMSLPLYSWCSQRLCYQDQNLIHSVFLTKWQRFVSIWTEHWLVVVWSILGKFGSSGGFVLIYQQGCEVFPTVLRSTGLGFMSLVGAAVNAGVPQLVFWVSFVPADDRHLQYYASAT
jgi:hypothetical protein